MYQTLGQAGFGVPEPLQAGSLGMIVVEAAASLRVWQVPIHRGNDQAAFTGRFLLGQ